MSIEQRVVAGLLAAASSFVAGLLGARGDILFVASSGWALSGPRGGLRGAGARPRPGSCPRVVLGVRVWVDVLGGTSA